MTEIGILNDKSVGLRLLDLSRPLQGGIDASVSQRCVIGAAFYDCLRRIDHAHLAAFFDSLSADIARVILHQSRQRPRVGVLIGGGLFSALGYCVARQLEMLGVQVVTYSKALPEDSVSLEALAKWHGQSFHLRDLVVEDIDVFVDGLHCPDCESCVLEGWFAHLIDEINASHRAVYALGLPYGLDPARTACGVYALRAQCTVLAPFMALAHIGDVSGRMCGGLYAPLAHNLQHLPEYQDIEVQGAIARNNTPVLWQNAYERLPLAHKYQKGAVLVVGGDRWKSGAARLAARSALSSGAGLVSVGCPRDAHDVYAADLISVMLTPLDTPDELRDIIVDRKINAVVLGMGLGRHVQTADMVLEVLKQSIDAVVIDADGLSAFRREPEILFEAILNSPAQVLLTPHRGEFSQLFPDLAEGGFSDVEMAQLAANRSGAIVVLKGALSVIACPQDDDVADGFVDLSQDDHHVRYLAQLPVCHSYADERMATAGSGDVLAGMIGAFVCRFGSSVHLAASAAVFLHARIASKHGAPLLAEEMGPVIARLVQEYLL